MMSGNKTTSTAKDRSLLWSLRGAAVISACHKRWRRRSSSWAQKKRLLLGRCDREVFFHVGVETTGDPDKKYSAAQISRDAPAELSPQSPSEPRIIRKTRRSRSRIRDKLVRFPGSLRLYTLVAAPGRRVKEHQGRRELPPAATTMGTLQEHVRNCTGGGQHHHHHHRKRQLRGKVGSLLPGRASTSDVLVYSRTKLALLLVAAFAAAALVLLRGSFSLFAFLGFGPPPPQYPRKNASSTFFFADAKRLRLGRRARGSTYYSKPGKTGGPDPFFNFLADAQMRTLLEEDGKLPPRPSPSGCVEQTSDARLKKMLDEKDKWRNSMPEGFWTVDARQVDGIKIGLEAEVRATTKSRKLKLSSVTIPTCAFATPTKLYCLAQVDVKRSTNYAKNVDFVRSLYLIEYNDRCGPFLTGNPRDAAKGRPGDKPLTSFTSGDEKVQHFGRNAPLGRSGKILGGSDTSEDPLSRGGENPDSLGPTGAAGPDGAKWIFDCAKMTEFRFSSIQRSPGEPEGVRFENKGSFRCESWGEVIRACAHCNTLFRRMTFRTANMPTFTGSLITGLHYNTLPRLAPARSEDGRFLLAWLPRERSLIGWQSTRGWKLIWKTRPSEKIQIVRMSLVGSKKEMVWLVSLYINNSPHILHFEPYVWLTEHWDRFLDLECINFPSEYLQQSQGAAAASGGGGAGGNAAGINGGSSSGYRLSGSKYWERFGEYYECAKSSHAVTDFKDFLRQQSAFANKRRIEAHNFKPVLLQNACQQLQRAYDCQLERPCSFFKDPRLLKAPPKVMDPEFRFAESMPSMSILKPKEELASPRRGGGARARTTTAMLPPQMTGAQTGISGGPPPPAAQIETPPAAQQENNGANVNGAVDASLPDAGDAGDQQTSELQMEQEGFEEANEVGKKSWSQKEVNRATEGAAPDKVGANVENDRAPSIAGEASGGPTVTPSAIHDNEDEEFVEELTDLLREFEKHQRPPVVGNTNGEQGRTEAAAGSSFIQDSYFAAPDELPQSTSAAAQFRECMEASQELHCNFQSLLPNIQIRDVELLRPKSHNRYLEHKKDFFKKYQMRKLQVQTSAGPNKGASSSGADDFEHGHGRRDADGAELDDPTEDSRNKETDIRQASVHPSRIDTSCTFLKGGELVNGYDDAVESKDTNKRRAVVPCVGVGLTARLETFSEEDMFPDGLVRFVKVGLFFGCGWTPFNDFSYPPRVVEFYSSRELPNWPRAAHGRIWLAPETRVGGRLKARFLAGYAGGPGAMRQGMTGASTVHPVTMLKNRQNDQSVGRIVATIETDVQKSERMLSTLRSRNRVNREGVRATEAVMELKEEHQCDPSAALRRIVFEVSAGTSTESVTDTATGTTYDGKWRTVMQLPHAESFQAPFSMFGFDLINDFVLSRYVLGADEPRRTAGTVHRVHGFGNHDANRQRPARVGSPGVSLVPDRRVYLAHRVVRPCLGVAPTAANRLRI
ncbi:unnamed protein product [Amoebophrya sp. A120]|nr:unnamed protein product [Amoebophrya sp. A120]|eukprot:GSA120T00019236001.1